VVEDQELVGVPETPPALLAHIRIQAGSEEIDYVRPVVRRYVDRVEGETTRPLVVVPPVAVGISDPVAVFPDAKPRTVEVLLRGNLAEASGELRWRRRRAGASSRPPSPWAGGGEPETSLAFTARSWPGR
jgi:hypothetical protein